MKLDKKKALAAKVFNVGKERIVFLEPRLEEIKEAITKEDIRSLKTDGAILIKEIRGKKSRGKKKKARRSMGNIRKNTHERKSKYILLTRKLRGHISELKNKNLLSKDQVSDMRKKLRNKYFRSKSHLKEYINTLEKTKE